MSDSADRVTLGLVPRKASLAPSWMITASVPSGIDQSSRSRPPEAVSPDTPALIMSTFIPLVSKDFCKRIGNAAGPDRPKPALGESPRTTILIGFAGAAGEVRADAMSAVIKPQLNTRKCTNMPSGPSTPPSAGPYDPTTDNPIEP